MSAAEDILDTLADLLAERFADRLAAKLAHLQPANAAPESPVSKTEACKALSIHRATLDRAVKCGCPFQQFGDRRRYVVSEVRAWFGENRAKSDKDSINIDKITKRLGLKRKGK